MIGFQVDITRHRKAAVVCGMSLAAIPAVHIAVHKTPTAASDAKLDFNPITLSLYRAPAPLSRCPPVLALRDTGGDEPGSGTAGSCLAQPPPSC